MVTQVAIGFSILHRRVLRHGSFEDRKMLTDRVLGFVRRWNEREAHPFCWTFPPSGRRRSTAWYAGSSRLALAPKRERAQPFRGRRESSRGTSTALAMTRQVPPRAVPLRLAAYYLAHFACIGVWLPFWSPWLAARGIDPDAIGGVVAIGYWVSIATSPIAGRIAERVGSARGVMSALAATAATGFIAFAQARSIAALAALALITFGAHGALLPLAESVVQAQVHAGRAQYGRIRLWGSLAFIATSIGAGRLIDETAIDVVPYLMAAGSIACLLAATGLPEERAVRARETGASIRWAPIAIAIGIASLIQATHAVYYGFGSLGWAAIGIDQTAIGALWALGVIAEIALFAASPAILARASPRALVIAGAIAAAARWALLARTESVVVIAFAQALHAISFGATHLGGMELLRTSVPRERLASAQGFYSAGSGIAFGIATPIAGALYERQHAGAYGVASIAALALAGLAVVALRGRRAT